MLKCQSCIKLWLWQLKLREIIMSIQYKRLPLFLAIYYKEEYFCRSSSSVNPKIKHFWYDFMVHCPLKLCLIIVNDMMIIHFCACVNLFAGNSTSEWYGNSDDTFYAVVDLWIWCRLSEVKRRRNMISQPIPHALPHSRRTAVQLEMRWTDCKDCFI